jgi:hypothetical protein
MATNRNSLAPEMVAFLQTLDSGNLYRIALGGGDDLLLSIREDGSFEFSGVVKCPFEEELLQKAVVVLGDSVFQFFSKAAIVAHWLNANLVQNQGKSQDEWNLIYYSGFGG